MRVVIVGGGVFGWTAAHEARARGWAPIVVDPGPVPHPLAESSDISKAIRADYGADDFYFTAMGDALTEWARWRERFGAELFHGTGVSYLTPCPMAPGTFEYESWIRLRAHGFPVERLEGAAVSRRFPAWTTGRYVDGYVNGRGGWAASGAVVARLAVGLPHRAGRVTSLVERGGRVIGVTLADGETLSADVVVLTTGAWITDLLPELAGCFRAVGQPVFHLLPPDPDRYREPNFLTFGADISQTGWYGFPLHPAQGVVKIANHGPGRPVHPQDEAARVVDGDDDARLRAFLVDTFPDLADAPIVHRRLCVYGDTADEHFWIAPDPGRAGLVVAAGGSGHAFKFAPLLGRWIADAVEGRVLPRFRWRPEIATARGEEAARARG